MNNQGNPREPQPGVPRDALRNVRELISQAMMASRRKRRQAAMPTISGAVTPFVCNRWKAGLAPQLETIIGLLPRCRTFRSWLRSSRAIGIHGGSADWCHRSSDDGKFHRNLAVAISCAPGAEMGRELPWRDRVEPVAVALWARPRFGGKRPSGIDVGRPQRVGRWLRLDDPMLTLRDGRAARGRSALLYIAAAERALEP